MIEKSEGHYRINGSAMIADARVLLEAGRTLLLAEPGKDIMLDFSAVGEVDSSTLGVVFGLMRTANEHGITLRLANPPANLLSLADLYSVSDSLPVT